MSESSMPIVAVVEPAESERAVATILLAFATDPMARWTYPDPQQYLLHFPGFIRALGGTAFADGTAWQADDHAGASVWLRPGAHSDEEALGALIETTLPRERQGEIGAIVEQMARHHPVEPHWYLPLIAVDPLHQRKGYGAALLQAGLQRCDREHLPAYLESSNPANIGLYQRHGFEITGTIQAESSPPVTPMLRAAR
ncbi:ribosomal protein S18 acetylase RimI-like enzyme [Inquilinus ginsengisoli]|jgi:ribosomal protein S18 acetylase RimI-like enzyme|uniref:GNAT family N-acetyltransferase n=1 Tax=Inquilinus ginsengisoli TaxID=363840 RepID=UPI003D24D7C5